MNELKIGIAGFGNMGSAIYHSIKNEYSVVLYDPYISKHEGLPFEIEFQEFIKKINLLILCVKPNQVELFLSDIKQKMDIVSIAAGIDFQTIRDSSPSGSRIIRMMPNLPMVVGEGAIGVFGDDTLYEIIQPLFENQGKLIHVKNENLMNAITGLSGSGPAYVFEFIHALAEGGVKSGLSFQDSLDLAIQTLKGSAIYLEKMNLHPIELRNRVTSPGGTTINGLYELEKNSFHATVMGAVEKASQRSEELGRK